MAYTAKTFKDSPYAAPILGFDKKRKLVLSSCLSSSSSLPQMVPSNSDALQGSPPIPLVTQLRYRGDTEQERPVSSNQFSPTFKGRSPSAPPPPLPHIDSFVSNKSLHLSSINEAIRNERRRVNRIKVVDVEKEEEEEEMLLSQGISRKDISNLVKFIKPLSSINWLNRFMDQLGDGDGEVSLTEMEAAIRKCRRANSNMSTELMSRAMVKRLMQVLKEKKLNVREWFELMDGSDDGKVSLVELRRGMAALTLDLPHLRFNESDLSHLISFMDPDCDGDLTAEEVILTFKKINMPPQTRRLLRAVGPVVDRLYEFMNERKMRIFDLFSFLDMFFL